MTRATFSYTHGDAGTKPSTALNFEQNERPGAQHFDWYWYNVIEAIKGHASEFTRLDSNDDGIVDEADVAGDADTLDGSHASAFAASGHVHDGRYVMESGDTMTGDFTVRSNVYIDNHDFGGSPSIGLAIGDNDTGFDAATDGEVEFHANGTKVGYWNGSQFDFTGGSLMEGGSRVATRTWVGNNADVPNADYADNAGQLEGNNASAFANSGHTHDGRYLNDGTGTVTPTNLNFNPATQGDLHAKYTDSEAVSAVNAEASLSVDISGDADTLDGNQATAFASSGHTHDGRYYTESQADSRFINDGDPVPHPTYSSKSNVPALNAGEVAYVSGDGLYVEDGS